LAAPRSIGEHGPTYIRAEGGHHHLVCSTCGIIIDFDQCMAGDMMRDLSDRFGFQIQSHLLEFYGTCVNCQSK
jgi:Fur family ferric uptake transcriptional regulator